MKKLKISFEEENKKDKIKRKYEKYPRIDQNTILFGNEEEVEAVEIDYIRKIKSKVLNRFLLPTVIISVLIIAACVATSLYFLSVQNNQISQINTEKYKLKMEVDKLNQDVNTLNRQIESKNNESSITQEQVMQALSEQDNSNTQSNNNWRETARKILQEHQYTSTDNSSSNERLCTVPDCNSRANTGSYYCLGHECLKVGCHESKANDLCMYCEKHKCDMPGCNSGKSLNSYYCSRHSN